MLISDRKVGYAISKFNFMGIVFIINMGNDVMRNIQILIPSLDGFVS